MPTVTDNFNRANENPLSGGGNWVACSGFGNLRLDSNQVGGADNNTDNQMYWAADEFNPDHYTQITIHGAGNDYQPMVRIDDAATDDFYVLYIADFTSVFFYEVSGGSFSQVGSEFNPSADDGDTVKFDATGNTLTAYFKGVQEGQETDSTHPNNTRLGIGMYDNNFAADYIDDFEGSDGLGAEPATAPKRRMYRIMV